MDNLYVKKPAESINKQLSWKSDKDLLSANFVGLDCMMLPIRLSFVSLHQRYGTPYLLTFCNLKLLILLHVI